MTEPGAETVTVTLQLPRKLWHLLRKAAATEEDLHEVAVRALEAGLEQASAPTHPGWRPGDGRRR